MAEKRISIDYGSISGGGLPDGETITPTNDVKTWLKCANITYTTYTTLNEVLADKDVLEQVCTDTNATKYLVRSTDFVSLCNNEYAMRFIGETNVCANLLLANDTWKTSICGSAYFEKVLNVKVPTMTDYTVPSGETSASSELNSTYASYKAFNPYDGDSDNWYARDGQSEDWVAYDFKKPVNVSYVYVENGMQPITSFKVQYYDGVWKDANSENIPISGSYQATKSNIVSGETSSKWRVFVVSKNTARCSLSQVQFYGREQFT